MRKLLWFSIGVILAAAIGMYMLQGSLYFLASGIAALILAGIILLVKRFSWARIAAVILLGSIVGFVWMSIFDSVYLSVPRAADGKTISLSITITDYTRETDYGVATVGVARLNDKPYKVNVYLPKDVALKPGDVITGRFTLRSTLPGGDGENQYAYSKGIFLTSKIARTPIIDSAEKMRWYCYPSFIRERVVSVLSDVFPEDVSGFAVALLIGDKSGMDYETDVAFQVSGISHIVAVSGFHVTVLFALIYTVLCKNRWLSAILGIPVLFIFAAVAGFSPSITRACLMHSLMILAMLFEKEYDPLTALAFAVVLMLSINPWTVTNVSFQLSLGCMFGILLISEPMKQWVLDQKIFARMKGKKKKLVGMFASSVSMTVGAPAFVTPLCAYYFRMVSILGVITNLLTLWVVSFIFYGVLLTFILGLLWQPAATLLAYIVSWPIRYVLGLSKILTQFPLAAVYTDSIFIIFWLVLVYLLLVANLLAHKKRILKSICCSVIGLCIALMASWSQPLLDECRVTVLDVGQGQCILLQADGKTYMVDCGGDSDEETANCAANTLLSQGIDTLDGLILTHYDRDHAGGVSYLMNRIFVDTVFLPTCTDVDGMLAEMDTTGFGYRIWIEENISITFGDSKITLIPSKTDLSDNEASLCVLFQTTNCDILITGDRSSAGERELMRQIELPDLEVLIVGHHGSKYSTGNMLLDKTTPDIAIISVGADNFYGHPAVDTLQRLEDAGCQIYRTDLHGTVIYRR